MISGEAGRGVGIEKGTDKESSWLWCKVPGYESQISASTQTATIPGTPSLDSFFQYPSWRFILTSVVTSFTSSALNCRLNAKFSPKIGKIKGRGNILDILVDDAVVAEILHTGQEKPGHSRRWISLALLSAGEELEPLKKFDLGKKKYG